MTRLRNLAILSVVTCVSTLPGHAQDRIAIGTGGAGGAFHTIGGSLASVLHERFPTAKVQVEVTAASIDNVRRVASGRDTLGISSSSTLYEAVKGVRSFASPQPVAAIAYLYPAVLQVAVFADSRFQSIDDLADAKVNLGPAGSSSAILAERLLTACNVFNREKARFRSYSWGAKAMLKGKIDAMVVLAGVPAATLAELAKQRPIRLLAIDTARAQALFRVHDFYEAGDVPANSYRGQGDGVPTVAEAAILFTNAHAPESLIHEITRTLFANVGKISDAHRLAQHIKAETATNTPVGLHPGAKRYFEEIAKKEAPPSASEATIEAKPAVESMPTWCDYDDCP